MWKDKKVQKKKKMFQELIIANQQKLKKGTFHDFDCIESFEWSP